MMIQMILRNLNEFPFKTKNREKNMFAFDNYLLIEYEYIFD